MILWRKKMCEQNVTYICYYWVSKWGHHMHIFIDFRKKDGNIISPTLIDNIMCWNLWLKNMSLIIFKHTVHNSSSILNLENLCIEGSNKCKYEFLNYYAKKQRQVKIVTQYIEDVITVKRYRIIYY